MKIIKRIAIVMFVLFIVPACATSTPKIDKYGCAIPSEAIVTHKSELETTAIVIGKVTLGSLNYTLTPEIKSNLANTNYENLVRLYYLCRMIHDGTAPVKTSKQKAYWFNKFMLYSNNPSNEAVDKWESKNPVPADNE